MSVEEIITDEECPLCGEHLTIIKNKMMGYKTVPRYLLILLIPFF